MHAELETDILKGVSRSFYLSLRLLPRPMRRAAGIAYLLARTSDTIADSASGSAKDRIDALQGFLQEVRGGKAANRFTEEFIQGIEDQREVRLLRHHLEILNALNALDRDEIALIHEVLETIVSGQILDLQRFGNPSNEMLALKDAGELEDYAWRVAGCVGLFWTRLGFLKLGDGFSSGSPAELETLAIEYGKGLQLVNILRDFPVDRRMGRCYLPVDLPDDKEACLEAFKRWREVAIEKIASGKSYAKKLHGKRLRLASGLPAIIAEETLKLLKISDLSTLEPRVKISRKHLYWLIFRECLSF